MNPRLWGIIGGVALGLALLSPLILGSSKKVETLFEDAENLYQRAAYEQAIAKYSEALKASTKRGVRTEVIDKDFTTLVNYKIARCYYELAEQSGDVNHYATAIAYIKNAFSRASVRKHQEELTYLWAQIFYKTEQLAAAVVKFTELRENFPNSRYIPEAQRVIARMTDMWQSRFDDAQALLDEGDYHSAYQILNDLASGAALPDLTEREAELEYKAAYCLHQLGKDDEALERFLTVITEFPGSPYVADAYHGIGQIYEKQQDYEKAQQNYEKAQQNYEKALQAFDSLSTDAVLPDLTERQAELEYKAAYCSHRLGKDDEALARFLALIEKFTNSPYVIEAYVGIGKIYEAQREYKNARQHYETALYATADEDQRVRIYKLIHETYLVPVLVPSQTHEEPDDSDAIAEHTVLTEANTLWALKRFAEASEKYEEFVRTNPIDDLVPYALYHAAACHYKVAAEGRVDGRLTLLEKSMTHFQRLIETYSTSEYTIRAYYRLAQVYLEWGEESGQNSKWRLVIKTVEEANEKYADSNTKGSQETLGGMNLIRDAAQKKLEEKVKNRAEFAIAEAEQEIEQARQDNAGKHAVALMQDAHKLLGYAQNAWEAGNYEYAVSLAAQAKEIARDAWAEAVERGKRAVRKKHYIDRGSAHLRNGEFEPAQKKANEALKIDPNYRAAHELLAKLKEAYYGQALALLDEKQVRRAIAMFNQVIAIDPNFAKAYCNLGFIYIEREEYGKAIPPLERAVAIDPQFKEAHFNLGLAYLRMGHFELSRNAAQNVLELCGSARAEPVCEAAEVLFGSIRE